MSSDFPEAATKITYIDGRPTEITLKRIKLELVRNGKSEEHTFDTDTITIGAAADNTLVIDDETVSRYHCRIFLERDTFLIRDLDSTNGTFVNRVRVREAFLKPNCVVNLGKSELRFNPVDEKLRIVPSNRDRFGDIIGGDAKMREIYSILEKIAPTDSTVIIEGETGTGKEVVARSIHQASKRKDGPFVVFDCGAVPENLIESELFGHEKGAFTGAISTRQGVFENAHGGTVFLDELGELQYDLQPKLLRVLEQREVKRVGGSKPIRVDVRVVAATNRDLATEVKESRFREDLFYRLSVVRVHLPALRKRKDDIATLVNHFLQNSRFNRDGEGGRKVDAFSHAAMQKLLDYPWPGNVRELLNVVERGVSFAESRAIEVSDLPDHVILSRSGAAQAWSDETRIDSLPPPPSGLSQGLLNGTFKDAKEQWVSSFEKDYIEHLLRQANFNISHAAREADIDRKYFRKLMKKYGITASGSDADADDADD
ncbi:MAG: sigma 54-interacting transcriptional regulator [Polyangiales bacterium]